MKISKKKIFEFIVIVTLIYAAFALFVPTINSPQVQEYTKNLGIYGPFVIIFYIVLSHVIPPLAGTPGFLLGISLYGFKFAIFLLYLASMISAIINFWIARKYGRKWVERLTDKKTMKEIDEFAQVEGTEVLFFSRLLGSTLHDALSYAFGLTKISFAKYITVTMIVSPFTFIANYYLFRDVDFASIRGVTIWFGSLLVLGLIFSYLVKKYFKKYRGSEESNSF